MALDVYWDKEPFSSAWDPVHLCNLIVGQTNWLLNMDYWFLNFLLCRWSNYQTVKVGANYTAS